MEQFESLLLPPATILGTPAAAGLNQKNSTSLALGTQTAFDFHPPTADLTPRHSRRLNPKMLNGARNPPKNSGGSNHVPNFIYVVSNTSLEVISKL